MHNIYIFFGSFFFGGALPNFLPVTFNVGFNNAICTIPQSPSIVSEERALAVRLQLSEAKAVVERKGFYGFPLYYRPRFILPLAPKTCTRFRFRWEKL